MKLLDAVTSAERLQFRWRVGDQSGQLDVRPGVLECRQHGGLGDVAEADDGEAHGTC